jgi:hypothetical protein
MAMLIECAALATANCVPALLPEVVPAIVETPDIEVPDVAGTVTCAAGAVTTPA